MKSYGAWLLVAFAASACARDASEPVDLLGVADAENTAADGASSEADAGSQSDAGVTPDANGEDPPGNGDDAGNSPDGSATQACDDVVPKASVKVGDATVDGVKVAGGGNTGNVAPGSSVKISMSYALSATSCLAIDLPFLELRVGFAEGATDCSPSAACISLAQGTPFDVTLKAPNTPGSYGVYAVTEHISAQLSSDSCGQPFQDAPNESLRIATICVK